MLNNRFFRKKLNLPLNTIALNCLIAKMLTVGISEKACKQKEIQKFFNIDFKFK